MTARLSLIALLGLFISAGHALALAQQQYQPRQTVEIGAPVSQPQGQSDAAAIVPRNVPTIQRRQPPMVQAPFQLNAQQQAEVDRVLERWAAASAKHKRIEIEFFRLDFNKLFGKPNEPIRIVQGEADMKSDGRWLWNVRGEWIDGKVDETKQRERWVCDGTSIYEFNFSEKIVTQNVLGDDVEGKDVVTAMLPFLFSPDAAKLNQRYLIRLLGFEGLPEGHICIDAWPRFQQEAANYSNAKLIVNWQNMQPTALMLTTPGENETFKYQFTKVKINGSNPLELVNDPFKVKTPSGWKLDVQKMPEPQITAQPTANAMR